MKTGKPFLPAIFGLMARLLSFAPALALESLVIAYPTTSSQFTPLWFARDVGLYEKYNLDGKLVFIQGGSVLLQAMIAGQAQAAQNGVAETVTAILRGGDLRMLGVTAKIFPYSLIAAKNVKSAKDLIGDPQTSIDDEVAASIDAAAFGRTLRRLQQYEFWDTASKPALHGHQQRAVETVVAYISADPHLPERPTLREARKLSMTPWLINTMAAESVLQADSATRGRAA